jgi:hypothetical protein
MTKTILLERESTNVIIGAFFEVQIAKPNPRRNSSPGPTVVNYLKATRIEVALILHFGPEAKFYRIVSSNK